MKVDFEEAVPRREESEDDVAITGYVEASGPTKKKRKLCFSKEEEDVIDQREMLSDESINVAQNLLSSQFPEIKGLQDTVLGKLQEFDVINKDKSYIQILHAGSLHWVCVANTLPQKTDNEIHYLYDSLKKKHISRDVLNQISSFSFHDGPQLIIHSAAVQQQDNGVDCGLYAIAFATSLAYGENPEEELFDKSKLREHLKSCFRSQTMTPFPKTTKQMPRFQTTTSTVELYCICRMPFELPKSLKFEMAECTKCKKWFHRQCENIPKEVFSSKQKEWLCSSC